MLDDGKIPKKPKKPLVFYYSVILLVLVLLNSFVFPKMIERSVQNVEYSEFVTMLDNKQITEATLDGDKVYFTTGTGENRVIYKTVAMEDGNDLVDRLNAANVDKFGKAEIKQTSPIVSFLLSWILPFVILFGLSQLLMKSLQKKMGGMGPGPMTFGKSNAKIYVEAQTGKTFADVAGEEEAKEALAEIVDFLHNPKKYAEIGAKLPKGALLVGPPGTGKTLLAKAVAGEAKVPFFSISGSEFVEMFVGMGAARVRDLFKQAQEKAPCIVFIDEIDAIGKKRDSGGLGGNDEREQTLNQLLTEMDGFDGSSGVVILAATNRPETLDKALLRPGRFDRRIPVELPDLKGREQILKVHLKAIRASDNININTIARATSGASGAEIANIVNEAALRAVRQGRRVVQQDDLEESVETVIAGYQRKDSSISTKEKLIVSYHEIGHALVAAMQKNSAPVHKITIIPRTSGALGYTMQVEEGERLLMTKQEAFEKIVTFTGGRAAEEMIFGSFTTGASNDIEQATKIARAMVTRYGMSDEFDMMALETVNNPYLGGDTSLTCSADTAAKVDAEVLKIIREAHTLARKILEENKDKLHELAKYLYEKETITGEEFMYILLKKKELPVFTEETESKE
ncbi:MAG: ATP-dependent zinc metalloprotease FtsH [Firmicutes bacterium]|uniref:ATP-dependent zinc metalloprotease FtsH n=1 Tax=Candidatus Scybalomonas excrementavium TaxID=2840943 RepID=A0A9D9HZ33_9FIRM|nr:ATP-dependent zinc metalloprotease FtsH [Candidatus Scybalomonas excrementavium]